MILSACRNCGHSIGSWRRMAAVFDSHRNLPSYLSGYNHWVVSYADSTLYYRAGCESKEPDPHKNCVSAFVPPFPSNCENGCSNQIPARLLCLPFCESAFPDVSTSVSVAPQCHFACSDTGCRPYDSIRWRYSWRAPISSKALPKNKWRPPAKNR